MKKICFFLVLIFLLLQTALPIFADEEQLWSNFNSDPVSSGPRYYIRVPVKQDSTVLLTRVRTYHWNNGHGAAPGTICIWENDAEVACAQAVGRSANGVTNVYWEALFETLLYPGHSYRVKVSDSASWSFNEGSQNCGMFELYGIWPAPEEYLSAAQQAPVSSNPSQSSSQASSQSSSQPSSQTNSSVSYSVPSSGTPVNTVYLGRYEQDNNYANGTEPIEWQILATEQNRMLVISRNVIDFKPYYGFPSLATWETSSLRQWLNNDFYNYAFTDAEKSSILLVTNPSPGNPKYGISGGNSTQDRIFVLSIDEANRYFRVDSDRAANMTSYARSIANLSGSTAPWVLRSPGNTDISTTFVDQNGTIYYEGAVYYSNGVPTYYGIRPAFWMRLAASGYRVTYHGGNCLAKVPTDNNLYQPGDIVTVLFDPVEYMDGLIFNGWDMDGDGIADFGYSYDKFQMPDRDVDLYAICYYPYQYDNRNNQGDYYIIDTQDSPLYPPNQGVYPDYYGVG